MHEPAEPRDPVDLQASFLSAREREVLQFLVEGGSTHNIARQLGVTHSTARTHTQNVLTKVGCHSRIEAVAFAAAHGVAYPSASQRLLQSYVACSLRPPTAAGQARCSCERLLITG
jgi:DNA-binding CsgD family transcriptional regulator